MAKEQPARRVNFSMRGAMLCAMLLVLVVVVGVFFAMVQASQLLNTLDDVSFRTLYNHATDRVSSFSSQLTQVSRNVRNEADSLQATMSVLQRSWPGDDGDAVLLDQMLDEALARMCELLDNNALTGAFVILHESYSGDEGAHAALYLRDPTPGVTVTNSADLTVLLGPMRLSSGHKLSLEKNWEAEWTLGDTAGALYQAPLEAARLYPKADSRDWGYWSEPLRLWPDDIAIITFTTPLLDGDGKVLGVLGVEFSLSYLTQIMPSGSLPFGDGFYMLGRVGEGVNEEEAGRIQWDTAFTANATGSRFLLEFDSDIPYTLEQERAGYSIYRVEGSKSMYVALVPLGLYGVNSPFQDMEYHLFALSPTDQVLASSQNVARGFFIALGISLPLALVAAALVSRNFSGRIEKLASEVRTTDPEQEMTLSPTGIREVDELADTLKKMSVDITQYAARMSTIVDLVGVPMGAFEIQFPEFRVYMTDSLFRLLGVPHGEGESHYISLDDFIALLPGMEFPTASGTHREVELDLGSEAEEKWMRIHALRDEENIYGTVIDITDEVRQKRWLEYERDYDPLTMLLNRNAYPGLMNEMIAAAPDEMGVLLFGDLDNLKFINDTFGHDMGDRYIKMAAEALRVFSEYGGVVARVSGDEFVAYLHGLGGREELRAIVDEGMRQVRAVSMSLPDGAEQKVRISVGVAFYPDDASDIDTLIQYADFAMYEIKHTVKGDTHEFNHDSYEKNSYILRKPNQLDYLIEGKRLRFDFQPIVDAHSGQVFAYEALMRPQTREFHTPLEVLSVARSQSKLYQIEHLTFQCIARWKRENLERIRGTKLFVNSIGNQLLTDEDIAGLDNNLEELLDDVVIEITEEERAPEIVDRKVELLRRMGCGIAIDDYGSGYSNESQLLNIHPDYLKVDMSIIRNIDSDLNRQKLLQQIVEYAQSSGIQVVAEGIESQLEMETAIRLGVRYLQGFYLGRPEYEIGLHSVEACRQAADCSRKLQETLR